MSFLDGLIDRLFPQDKHPGVGILGRVFLDASSPRSERRLLLPPSGTGIGREQRDEPPPAGRERHASAGPQPPASPWPQQDWPYQQWPDQQGRPRQDWPYRPWPGQGRRL